MPVHEGPFKLLQCINEKKFSKRLHALHFRNRNDCDTDRIRNSMFTELKSFFRPFYRQFNFDHRVLRACCIRKHSMKVDEKFSCFQSPSALMSPNLAARSIPHSWKIIPSTRNVAIIIRVVRSVPVNLSRECLSIPNKSSILRHQQIPFPSRL